jgi:hypothetical protein
MRSQKCECSLGVITGYNQKCIKIWNFDNKKGKAAPVIGLEAPKVVRR